MYSFSLNSLIPQDVGLMVQNGFAQAVGGYFANNNYLKVILSQGYIVESSEFVSITRQSPSPVSRLFHSVLGRGAMRESLSSLWDVFKGTNWVDNDYMVSQNESSPLRTWCKQGKAIRAALTFRNVMACNIGINALIVGAKLLVDPNYRLADAGRDFAIDSISSFAGSATAIVTGISIDRLRNFVTYPIVCIGPRAGALMLRVWPPFGAFAMIGAAMLVSKVASSFLHDFVTQKLQEGA